MSLDTRNRRMGPWDSLGEIVNSINDLENTNVKCTWFESVASGTSGTITAPTGATILLDQWSAGVDVLVSGISSGIPDYKSVVDTEGAIITGTLDAAGAWTISGTPGDGYPISLIYVYRVALSSFDQAYCLESATIEGVNTLSLLGDLANELSGFPDDYRDQSTIAFVNGTRTFSITPVGDKFSVWVLGNEFIYAAAETQVIPDTEGIHWIYFDAAGAIQVATNPNEAAEEDLIKRNALIAYILWDATNNESTIFADERHGLAMDGATHFYLHEIAGYAYYEGLNPGDLDVDGSGDDETSAQMSFTQGTLFDEDIKFETSDSGQTLSVPAQIPVYYIDGVTGTWRKDAADNNPVKNFVGGSSMLAYNSYSEPNWGQTEVTTNQYVLAHIFATNDIDEPIIAVQGQADYISLATARTGADTELLSLQTNGLPAQEFTALFTFIFQTKSSYLNTPKARVRSTDGGDDYIDWRTSTVGSSGSSSGAGDVFGPAGGVVDNEIVYYDSTTGKLIKGSGMLIIDDDSMGTASDTNVSTSEAIVAYVTATVIGIGAGDVVGPTSATDLRITLFDSTTGKLIKESALSITSGVIAGTGLALTTPIINTILTAVGKTGAAFTEDGAATLYYNELSKLATTATGATVTGELIAGQVTGLNAPDAAGEAVRTTTNITEVNLLALTGGGDTTLHDHDGISENTSARHIQGTDTTLGTMTADINMGSSYQLTNLAAPAGLGEAIRSTTNVTETNMLALTGGGETALHSHAGGGAGDVVGPGSSIDNEVALFDSTTGKLIKGGSGLTIVSAVIAGAGLELTTPIINTILTATGKTGATFTEDGAVTLYHNEIVAAASHNNGSDGYGMQFGTNGELRIYKDVSSGAGYFHNETDSAHVFITGRSSASAFTTMILCDPDGSVDIYYNNAKVLQTSQYGLQVSDDNFVAQETSFAHVNNHGYITNTVTSGHFLIRSYKTGPSLVNLLEGDPDGSLDLYYAGVKAFETTSVGVKVTRTGTSHNLSFYLSSAGNAVFHNNVTSALLEIYGVNDSVASQIVFRADPDTSVDLFYDGVKAFETTSVGVKVTRTGTSHNLSLYPDSAGNLILQSNVQSSNLTLYGLNDSAASQVVLRADPDTSVDLFYDGVQVFYTKSNGIIVSDGTGEVYITKSSGDTYITNMTNSGLFHVRGQDVGGVANELILGDPDGSVDFYYDGTKVFASYQTSTFYGITLHQDSTEVGRIYTDSATGSLYYTNKVWGGDIIFTAKDSVGAGSTLASFRPDGACDFYYDNIKAVTTFRDASFSGIKVWGLDGSTYSGALYVNSIGSTLLRGLVNSGIVAVQALDSGGTARNCILGNADGAAELYYDGTKTFATSAAGAWIIDGSGANPVLKWYDDSSNDLGKIQVLANDMTVEFGTAGSGNTFSINGYTGATYDICLRVTQGGAVDLYFNDVKKFETTATGATVTGTMIADGATINGTIAGTGLTITTPIINTILTATGKNGATFVADGAATLYHNEVAVFQTQSKGLVLMQGTLDIKINAQASSPEGVVISNIGSLFLQSDGGANASLWVKESGGSSTGWVSALTTSQLALASEWTAEQEFSAGIKVTYVEYEKLPADDTGSGATITADVDTNTVGIGGVLLLGADGSFDDGDASAEATAGGMLVMATAAGIGDTVLLTRGTFQDAGTWAWTPGATLYLSETAGQLTETAPTTSGAIVRIMGYALTADSVWFDPDKTYVEV